MQDRKVIRRITITCPSTNPEDALYKRANTTSTGSKSHESVMNYKKKRRHVNRYSRATVAQKKAEVRSSGTYFFLRA